MLKWVCKPQHILNGLMEVKWCKYHINVKTNMPWSNPQGKVPVFAELVRHLSYWMPCIVHIPMQHPQGLSVHL